MATAVADSIPLLSPDSSTLFDEYINGLVQGGAWRTGSLVSSPISHTLTYSFNINDDGTYPDGPAAPGAGGTWGASPAMQTAVTQALAAWSNVANITFTPQAVNPNEYYFQSTADLAFTLTGDDFNVDGQWFALALGFFPDPAYADSVLSTIYTRAEYPKPEGDVFFDNYHTVYTMLSPGGIGFTTVLHEIGHALGLKHPGDDGGNFPPWGATFANLGIGAYNSMQYTVMNENIGMLTPSVSGFAATPMPLDILAIQHIYGANMSYHAGDDTYVLANDGVLKTIWDAGGTDTFTASDLFFGVTIDLNPGAYSTHGTIYGPLGNIGTAIAYNVTIENAVGGYGSDTIVGNAAANNLAGGVGDDTITGGAGNDTLAGGSNNDTLTGGLGVDSLVGGDGNDIHMTSLTPTAGMMRIAFTPDIITESAGEGIDTAYSSGSYALPANVENLVLTGGAFWRAQVGTGNDLGNVLTGQGSARHQLFGNGGNDSLVGGNGRDLLDGGAGFDFYAGGAGDDTYVVDGLTATHSLLMQGEPGDYISQGQSYVFTNQSGTFSVYDAFDLTGDGQVDFLRLNYSGGSHDWTLVFSTDDLDQNLAPGNYTDAQRASFAQEGHPGLDVYGNGRGSNEVFGSFTIDSVQFNYGGPSPVLVSFSASFEQHSESPTAPALTGTIRYNVASDIIEPVQESAGGGSDTIQSAASATLPDNVENLALTGVGDLNGTGNDLGNRLAGNGGANVLAGGAGADTLSGGAGSDVFLFDTAPSADTILDFASGTDHINLENAIFTAFVAPGTVAAANVQVGLDAAINATSGDADDHLKYASDTGHLYYDSNGSTAGGLDLIATVYSSGTTPATLAFSPTQDVVII